MKKYIIYIITYGIIFHLSAYAFINITQPKEYEELVLNAVNPIVVKFAAPWCTVCQSIWQPYEEIKQDKAFCDTIMFIDINIDDAPQLCQELDIQGIPTFKFIQHGRTIHQDMVGVKNPAQFKESLCNTINTAFELQKEDGSECYVRPEWQNKIINGGIRVSSMMRELTRKSITTTISYTTQLLDWIKNKVDTWLC